jgi:hypothetical protein
MRPTFAPLHLLAFAEAPADDLVDRGFDKAGADALPVPISLGIIGDEGAIAVNIRVKLLHGFEEFPCGAIASRGRRVEVHLDRLHHLERPIHVPIPQKPLQPFQFPQQVVYLQLADKSCEPLSGRLRGLNQTVINPRVRFSRPRSALDSSCWAQLPHTVARLSFSPIPLQRLRLWPRWHAEEQHLAQRPHPIGQSGRHRWRAGPPLLD